MYSGINPSLIIWSLYNMQIRNPDCMSILKTIMLEPWKVKSEKWKCQSALSINLIRYIFDDNNQWTSWDKLRTFTANFCYKYFKETIKHLCKRENISGK